MNENKFSYSIIPTSVMQDADLSSSEKLLFGVIMRYANNNQKCCWATNSTLAKELAITSVRVSQLIRHLQKFGYIKCKYCSMSEEQKTSRYIFVTDKAISDSAIKNSATNGKAPQADFTPPTENEVIEFCRTENIDVDARAFIAYYASIGWKVGNNQMKDWQAGVVSWSRKNFNNKQTNSFSVSPGDISF